jgi:trehalose synthase-fused probable maltokinase
VEATDDVGVADRYLVAFAVGPGAGSTREAHAGDGVWRTLAAAIADGRVVRSAAGGALVCRPGLGLSAFAPDGAAEIARWEERALVDDRSNASAVLGDRLVLKPYRRVVTGLNPELELVAYLAEERGKHSVPALGGSAEYIGPDGTVATVAILQELVPDADDAYAAIETTLAGWIAAPGIVALEFATEDAAALGTALADVHATLADRADLEDFVPREADQADLAGWRARGEADLAAALDLLGEDGPLGSELHAWAPVIRERLAAIEQPTNLPLLTRIHGDLDLHHVLRSADGFVFIGFDGDPGRTIDERRALASPLSDLADLLCSFDDVATSAERIALAGGWSSDDHSGIDLPAWRRRSRERLSKAWSTGVRRSAPGLSLDERLLDGFAVARRCADYVRIATDRPDRLWAPQMGMRRLIEGERGR